MTKSGPLLHRLGAGKTVAYTPTTWAFLSAAVTAGRPILVGGSTYSGKSALLAALITAMPAAERIALVANTPELIHFLPDDHAADNVYFFEAGDRYPTSTSSKPEIGDRVGDTRFWKLAAALTSKAAYAECTRVIFEDMAATDIEMYQYLRVIDRFRGAAAAVGYPISTLSWLRCGGVCKAWTTPRPSRSWPVVQVSSSSWTQPTSTAQSPGT